MNQARIKLDHYSMEKMFRQSKLDKSWIQGKIPTLFEVSQRFLLAEVAELADALRSGRSGSTPVWVQIPPSALPLS